MLESYQYFDDSPVYPYKEFIESIYKKRMQFKNDDNPLQLPLKVILNSIYGKTAQRVGNKIGNLFSPVIASTITGMTRAMLYEFVQKQRIEDDVVSFAPSIYSCTLCSQSNLNQKNGTILVPSETLPCFPVS